MQERADRRRRRLDQATVLLREHGLAAAAKKADREAREGLISRYIHTGVRVGVLMEVNCETDFVARTDDFQDLVRDLAVQVAGLDPQAVDADHIPADVLEAKKAVLIADDVQQSPRPSGQDRGWPDQEVALAGLPLDQPFRDAERKSRELITDRISRSARTSSSAASPSSARGGAVTGIAMTAASDAKPLRIAAILLKLRGEASSATARTASTRRLCVHRPELAESTVSASRSGSSSAAATSSADWRRPRAAWTGPPATTWACSPRSSTACAPGRARARGGRRGS